MLHLPTGSEAVCQNKSSLKLYLSRIRHGNGSVSDTLVCFQTAILQASVFCFFGFGFCFCFVLFLFFFFFFFCFGFFFFFFFDNPSLTPTSRGELVGERRNYNSIGQIEKNSYIWSGEMAQWLTALAAPSEDPGSVPRTHMALVCHSISRGSIAIKDACGGRAVVAHAFNPSTWEAEAGGFLSSSPAWSTQ
jgi:hypothetical protein